MPEQNFERAPATPSQPLTPERGQRTFERPTEVAAPRPVQRIPVRQTTMTVPAPLPATRPVKSETLSRIEHVMEDRLQEVFRQMPPGVKEEFRTKGEQTASQIEQLLSQVKVQSKKIFKLLFEWLRIIPGVNKYFLEQEAKLKTDELMRVKQELDRERGESALM